MNNWYKGMRRREKFWDKGDSAGTALELWRRERRKEVQGLPQIAKDHRQEEEVKGLLQG